MCEKDLEIIKGDTLSLIIYVDDGFEMIEEIYFTSKLLGINEKATYFGENAYKLIIPSEKTKTFALYHATYDITAILKNTHTQTAIYNGYIYIYEKENVIYE